MTEKTTPWYTDQEIDDLCAGLATNAAKCRHLRAQGLTVTQKPNGRPLVMRAHAEAVLAGLAQVLATTGAPQPDRPRPDRAALVLAYGSKRAAV